MVIFHSHGTVYQRVPGCTRGFQFHPMVWTMILGVPPSTGCRGWRWWRINSEKFSSQLETGSTFSVLDDGIPTNFPFLGWVSTSSVEPQGGVVGSLSTQISAGEAGELTTALLFETLAEGSWRVQGPKILQALSKAKATLSRSASATLPVGGFKWFWCSLSSGQSWRMMYWMRLEYPCHNH